MHTYKYDFCIFVATHDKDFRLARILCESIRFFYPNIPIVILKDGDFPLRELYSLGRIEIFDREKIPTDLRKLKGAFTKFWLLINDYAERFLYLDADTILIGSILDLPYKETDFLMVPALYDLNKESHRAMLKKFQFDIEKIREFDQTYNSDVLTLFVTGAWFGRSHCIKLERIVELLEYYYSQPTIVEQKRVSSILEQGLLGYLLTSSELRSEISIKYVDFELRPSVEQIKLYSDLKANLVLEKSYTKKYNLHYTGPLRNVFLRSQSLGEIPIMFNQMYYRRFSYGVHLRDDILNLPFYLAFFKRKIIVLLVKVKRSVFFG